MRSWFFGVSGAAAILVGIYVFEVASLVFGPGRVGGGWVEGVGLGGGGVGVRS